MRCAFSLICIYLVFDEGLIFVAFLGIGYFMSLQQVRKPG